MKRNEVLKKIMNGIKPKLSEYRFFLKKTEQDFIREKDQDILLRFSLVAITAFDHNISKAGVIVEPSVHVHVRKVEEIYSKITLRQVEHVTELITIGNTLANIIANPAGNYKFKNKSLNLFVHSVDDIEIISQKLISYFENVAMPYFDKNASWKELNNILNNNLSIDTVHCLIEPERHLKGLIVAKLLGSNEIDKLIAAHTKRIKEMSDDDCEIELGRLLSIFESITPIEIDSSF